MSGPEYSITPFTRLRLLAAALAALLVVTTAVLSSPQAAHADTVSVTTTDGFRTAVTSGCGSATAANPRVVVVAADFGASYDSTITYVSCHVRVDLAGHSVRSGAIALRNNTSMHLMSSTGSGTLTAYAYSSSSSLNQAGIRTTNAVLTIDGVTVNAAGGPLGAGIGGGGVSGYGTKSAESGGTINILGGAQVRAYGTDRGAAIGGGAAMAGGHGTGANGDGGVGRGGSGGTVTISGATTYVYASGTYGAGIGGGNGIGGNSSADGGRGGVGATLTVSDHATVSASSYRGAGIGGGTGTGYGTTYGGQGGKVVVDDATVSASSSIAAGIGGGDSSERGAHGGTLEVRAGAVVTASSYAAGAGFGTGRLGANNDSESMKLTVAEGGTLNVSSRSMSALRLGRGSATIDGTVNVTSATLTVDSQDFVIGTTGVLSGPGKTLNGVGRITNEGVIRMGTVTGVGVDRNNFPVRLHRAGGSTHDTRVYGPGFAAAGVTLPSAVSGYGWNAADDGSGAWFRSSTPITPTLMSTTDWQTNTGATVLHLWESAAPEDTITVNLTSPAAVTAGQWFDIDVSLYDAFEDRTLADTSDFTLAVQGATVETSTDGWRILAAGDFTISATIVYDGEEYQQSAPIQVAPGATQRLTLTPETAVAEDGQALTFDAVGYDAWGNETPTSSPHLTSSATADDVDGFTVTFHGRGARELTLHAAGTTATGTAQVQVYDEATRYEVRLYVDDVVQAGTAFLVDATLVDKLTDAVVEDPYTLTLTTSRDATPFVAGPRVEEQAGPITLFATASYAGLDYHGELDLEVLAGALHTLRLTPGHSVVYRHESVTFTVDGEDAYGNVVDTAAATLQNVTAGTTPDTGRTLAFDDFGVVTVRAALGTVHTDVTVEVQADPARVALTLPPAAGTSVAGHSIPLQITLTDPVTEEIFAPSEADIVWTSTSGSLVDAGDETGVETAAGSHVQTATVEFAGLTLQATRTWTVTAAEAATLTLDPTGLSTTGGASHTFTIAAKDAYGNHVDTAAATLTSTSPADAVTGHTVTFHGAGTRQITASLDGATASTDVRVVSPATRPSGAPSTTSSASPDDPAPVAEAPETRPSEHDATPGETPQAEEPASDDAEAGEAAAPWWIWLLLLLLLVAAAVVTWIVVAVRRRSRAL